jgi:hypothetical protein
VVALDATVGVFLGVVKRGGDQLFDGLLERRDQVGDDLNKFGRERRSLG